jgi:hypothetical protein
LTIVRGRSNIKSLGKKMGKPGLDREELKAAMEKK